LQEFLDSIDKEAEQVRAGLPSSLGRHAPKARTSTHNDLCLATPQIKLSLLAAFGEQAAARGDIDASLLSALVSLASVAPSANGPEAYIAEYARKYM
jgi:hypothetical protein